MLEPSPSDEGDNNVRIELDEVSKEVLDRNDVLVIVESEKSVDGIFPCELGDT